MDHFSYKPLEKSFYMVNNNSIGWINKVISTHMEENGKIQEQTFFHLDAMCNCANQKCFLYPMLRQVLQQYFSRRESTAWGEMPLSTPISDFNFILTVTTKVL